MYLVMKNLGKHRMYDLSLYALSLKRTADILIETIKIVLKYCILKTLTEYRDGVPSEFGKLYKIFSSQGKLYLPYSH